MVKSIDILIPVTDGFDYLLRLIDSIKKYTHCEYNIYVYNNCSKDDISKITNNYKDIKIINSKKNIGFGPALNRLLKISDSPYVLITNADIWFDDDVISKLLNILKDKEFIGIAPLILSEDDKIQRTVGNVFPNIFNIFIEFCRFYDRFKFFPIGLSYIFPVSYHRKNLSVSHVENSFVIFKREVFEKYGMFDEDFILYFEDIEFQRRFAGKEKIYFCKDLKVYHKGKGMTMLKGKDFIVNANRIRNRSLLLYFKRYRNPFEFLILHNFLKVFYGRDFLNIDNIGL